MSKTLIFYRHDSNTGQREVLRAYAREVGKGDEAEIKEYADLLAEGHQCIVHVALVIGRVTPGGRDSIVNLGGLPCGGYRP